MDSTTFFEKHPMLVFINEGEKIVDANKSAAEFFGLKRDQLLGKKVTEIGEWRSINDLSHKISKEQESVVGSKVWVTKKGNGQVAYLKPSVSSIEYENRVIKVAIYHDLTSTILEQKNPVSRSLEQETFPVAEVEWHDQKGLIRWNQRAEELFGFTLEESKNDVDFGDKIIHEDDRGYVEQKFYEAVKEGKKHTTIINRNYRKDGTIIYCEWHNSLIYDSQGRLLSVHSLVNDINDRIEYEHRVIEARDSYIDLFNAVSDAIYIQDEEQNFIEVNDGLCSIFGYSREELIGQSISKLEAPGKMDHDWYVKVLESVLNNEPQNVEIWCSKRNGEVFPMEVSISKGSFFGKDVIINVARDISDRYTSEEELKHRNELFYKLFDASPIGIAILNKHKEVVMVNQGFEDIFQYEPDEIIGLELDKVIVQEEYRDEAASLTETAVNIECVTKRRKKDGTLTDVIIYGIPVIIEGKMAAIYGLYVDITDQKDAEMKIERSLKEKEVLLAEIHHRVKNNLAVITGLLELQMNQVTNNDAWDVLKESQMRIHSIALVHEKLYQSEDLAEISFDVYILQLLQMMKRFIRGEEKEIHVETDLDEVSLTVNQAIPCGLWFNEIMTNAYKHAFNDQDEGTIKVEFKDLGDKLRFTVSDNGVGLPDNVDQLMKSSLGMRLIRTLAKQLNADFQMKNHDGSKFEIVFNKEHELI